MWDGIGGAIKRALRRDLVDGFTLRDNLESIQLPIHCFQHQEAKVRDPKWLAEHKNYTIDEYINLWVPRFERPRIDEEYSTVEDIRIHRSFMALSNSKLRMRLHDCWCRKCRACGTASADDADLLPCPHAVLWPWKDREARREQTVGVRADRKRLEADGRALAAQLKIGDFVAVQVVKARGRRGDHEDCYWVGVVVDQGNQKPTYQVPVRREINGVEFDKGEIAVAVRWLEREESDVERRTFRMGEDDKSAYGRGEKCLYFNAALLRAVPTLQRKTPAVVGRDTRTAAARSKQARWVMPSTTHTGIEKKCYY